MVSYRGARLCSWLSLALPRARRCCCGDEALQLNCTWSVPAGRRSWQTSMRQDLAKTLSDGSAAIASIGEDIMTTVENEKLILQNRLTTLELILAETQYPSSGSRVYQNSLGTTHASTNVGAAGVMGTRHVKAAHLLK